MRSHKSYAVAVTLALLFVCARASAYAAVLAPTLAGESEGGGYRFAPRSVVAYNVNEGALDISWPEVPGAVRYAYRYVGLNEAPVFSPEGDRQAERAVYERCGTVASTGVRKFTISEADMRKAEYVKIEVSACGDGGEGRTGVGLMISASPGRDCAAVIWDTLTGSWGLTPAQAAGIMGNIDAESSYWNTNAEGRVYPGLDNFSDYAYSVNDGIGYGICQWTYAARKQGLLDKANAMGGQVYDISVQLAYMRDELNAYGFMDRIRASDSLYEVSDLILLRFERPLNAICSIADRRAKGEAAYWRFMEVAYHEICSHVPGAWRTETPPSCAACGVRTRLCAACGVELERRDVAATAHTPGEWREVLAAAEKTEGRQARICGVCGAEVESRAVPATGRVTALRLPDSLTALESGTLSGTDARVVYLSANCARIGSGALANCPNLIRVYIPAMRVSIAKDAFSGSPNVTIVAPENGDAHRYAREMDIPFAKIP